MNERDIFLAVIEISDPVERAAYIERTCGDNSRLRGQVKELLKTHEQASKFLETPAAATDSVVDRTVLIDNSDSDEDSDDEAVSGEAEFRKYLQPATRTGWLGHLGHYEIEAILGRGAFGIVAKAFDEKLHRVVAIKLMNPELAATSPPRKRFLREARTAAAVTHENIVAIHAVEEEPIPYLVMEYISGQTLQQRMNAQGPLEILDILRLGRQIASGMAAAHAVKLIHRDIKPSNILLADGPNEKAKISDFGLARAVDDATMTASGVIAGTPLYMAPEQARGETLDHRADLFSLGSVLYQMAGGRPPFRAANTVAVLKRVCEDAPRPLGDVLPGTPDWLEAIIFKLLEKERNDRYQTAQEVADLLEQCESELRLQGFVSCVPEAKSFVQKSYPPKRSTAVKKKTDKNAIGWIPGAILCISVLLGLIWAANSSSRNTQEVASLAFDGENTYVWLPDYEYRTDTNPYTIEVWATPTGFPKGGRHHETGFLFGKSESALRIEPDGHWLFSRRGANPKPGQYPYQLKATRPARLGQRAHLAGVFENNTLRFYVDGKLQEEVQDVEITSENSWFELGAIPAARDQQRIRLFHGTIDEARFSSSAKYTSDFTPVDELPLENDTIALYHFDEGDGTELRDSSGNRHHGKIVGATWVKPKSGTIESSPQ